MNERKKIRPATRPGGVEIEETKLEAEAIYEEEPGMETEDLYRIYMEELAAIAPCTPEENIRLVSTAQAGNQDARNRLVEGNLKKALLFVRDYMNKGVPMVDLIQEASIELLILADTYRPEDGAYETELERLIRARLEDFIKEQKSQADLEEEILARVNVLQEVSRRMAEELGREATMAELAERMKMTEDEIREIMKQTMDALSVSEANRNLGQE